MKNYFYYVYRRLIWILFVRIDKRIDGDRSEHNWTDKLKGWLDNHPEQAKELWNEVSEDKPEQKEEPEAAGQEQDAVDHANRILFSNLKYQIGNIFTEKFLEHNDGKFHAALELNPAIHAVTEFVFEKIKQQKP